MSGPSDPSRPAAGGALDWARTRRRLDEISARLADADPADALADRLARRAARLAAPEPDDRAETGSALVVFGRAGMRYALDISATLAVIPADALVPLPGVGGCHLGLVIHRGSLHAVIDPNVLLDRDTDPPPAPAFAVLLDHPGCALGLAADVLHGVVRRDGAGPGRPGLLAGLLPDGTGVLSATALAGHAGLIVDHRLRPSSGS